MSELAEFFEEVKEYWGTISPEPFSISAFRKLLQAETGLSVKETADLSVAECRAIWVRYVEAKPTTRLTDTDQNIETALWQLGPDDFHTASEIAKKSGHTKGSVQQRLKPKMPLLVLDRVENRSPQNGYRVSSKNPKR